MTSPAWQRVSEEAKASSLFFKRGEDGKVGVFTVAFLGWDLANLSAYRTSILKANQLGVEWATGDFDHRFGPLHF